MAKKRRRTKKEEKTKKSAKKETKKGKMRVGKWLRDAGVVSLGFISLSGKGKVSKAYSVKKCRTEGKRLRDKYMDKARDKRDCLLKNLNIATQSDLDSLERRIKR